MNPSWQELVGGRALVRACNAPHAIEIYILEVSPSGKHVHAHMPIVGNASWIDINTIDLIEVLPTTPSLRETLRSWEILTELRTYSRDTEITIMTDDEEEGSGSHLLIVAPWTNDEEVDYFGDTLLKALESAKEEKDAYANQYGQQ